VPTPPLPTLPCAGCRRWRHVATPPAPTPPLVTLRSQELQPFAQALGDLVEVGHARVGEALVEAATTPPALGLGIGGLFGQPSLTLSWFRCRLVRGRLFFLALLLFVSMYTF
jgi:hypothetical protein